MTSHGNTRERAPRDARPLNELRRWVAELVGTLVRATIMVGLILLTPVGRPIALAESKAGSSDVVLSRIDEIEGVVQQLRALLDRTQFDVDAVANELAFSTPEEISAWVSEHVGFEQYVGVLRGAQGTLASGAGNAFDQAVLLATLIKDAGYDARIARGRLTRPQALALVRRIRSTPPTGPLFEDVPAAKTALERLAGLVGTTPHQADILTSVASTMPDTVHTPEFRAATADQGLLSGTLRQAGINLASTDITSELVNEARDYAWVEYRTSPSETWQQAHPAFPEGLSGTPPDASEVFTETIPDALLHRLRITVTIERIIGGRVETKLLFDPWERPVANLYGTAINFTMLPDGLRSTADFANADEALARTKYMIPLFYGSLPPGSRYLDLHGNLVPPDAANSPFAGIFQSVGENASKATSALGALGNEASAAQAQELTAEWLDITFLNPDGEETSFRRTLFDRIGVAGRESGALDLIAMPDGKMADALASTLTMLVASGSYPTAYVADQRLHALDLYLRALSVSQRRSSDDGEQAMMSVLSNPRVAALDLLTLYTSFDSVRPTLDATGYRAEPSLVMTRAGVVPRGAAIVDVVRNGRRSLSLHGGAVFSEPGSGTLLGAWETRTEGLVLGRSSGTHFSPAAHITEAQRTSGHLTVIPPGGVEQLHDISAPAESIKAMQRDVTRGFAVVVAVPSPTDSHVAWWRVNPKTGETLGRRDAGLGSFITWLQLNKNNLAFLGTFGTCIGFASPLAGAKDPGISHRDLAICAGGGLATSAAVASGASLGVIVAAAVVAALNGVWLNLDPSWDSNAF